MKKIISLYQRNYDGDHLVRDEIVPGAEWVLSGEGIATRKFDGSCCMVRNGLLYKRHDCKKGKKPPFNWEAAQEADPITGHHPGWVPVGGGPDDRWHVQAFNNQPLLHKIIGERTFELCGPKVNGNPEKEYVEKTVGCGMHLLIGHGCFLYGDIPPSAAPGFGTNQWGFDGLKNWLAGQNIEGIVWHHQDGRMVKIKKKDFGLKR